LVISAQNSQTVPPFAGNGDRCWGLIVDNRQKFVYFANGFDTTEKINHDPRKLRRYQNATGDAKPF